MVDEVNGEGVEDRIGHLAPPARDLVDPGQERDVSGIERARIITTRTPESVDLVGGQTDVEGHDRVGVDAVAARRHDRGAKDHEFLGAHVERRRPEHPAKEGQRHGS